jgi:hypothetical protein
MLAARTRNRPLQKASIPADTLRMAGNAKIERKLKIRNTLFYKACLFSKKNSHRVVFKRISINDEY